MVLQAQPRRKFLKSLGLAGAAALSAPYLTRVARAAAPEGAAQGLRTKIDHIVVLFQENRSFDHYFGVYKNPAGAMVTNLLDPDGRVDSRFTGLQKNPAGIPYNWLPVPEDIPGFRTRHSWTIGPSISRRTYRRPTMCLGIRCTISFA